MVIEHRIKAFIKKNTNPHYLSVENKEIFESVDVKQFINTSI